MKDTDRKTRRVLRDHQINQIIESAERLVRGEIQRIELTHRSSDHSIRIVESKSRDAR